MFHQAPVVTPLLRRAPRLPWRCVAIVGAWLVVFATPASAQLVLQIPGLLPNAPGINGAVIAPAPAIQTGVLGRAAAPLVRGQFLYSQGTGPENPFSVECGDAPVECGDEPVEDGFWLYRKLTAAWLAPLGARQFAMLDVDMNSTFAVPLPAENVPRLVAIPGLGYHAWNGPNELKLPANVYDLYIDFIARVPWNERLALNLGVTPGIYSDFANLSSGAFQVTGWGMLEYVISPKLKLLGGAAVVRQLRTSVLPVGGLIWLPNERTRVELVLPRPRVAYRLHGDETRNIWAYVAGQFGGGSWQVTQTDGTNALVTYSDLRWLLGAEWNWRRGLGGFADVGYVFARDVSAFDISQYQPSSTLLLRASLTF